MWGQEIIINTHCMVGMQTNLPPTNYFQEQPIFSSRKYDGYVSPPEYKQSLISHNCLTLSVTCMPETFLRVLPHKLYLEKVPLCGLCGDSSESVQEVVLLCRSVLHRP